MYQTCTDEAIALEFRLAFDNITVIPRVISNMTSFYHKKGVSHPVWVTIWKRIPGSWKLSVRNRYKKNNIKLLNKDWDNNKPWKKSLFIKIDSRLSVVQIEVLINYFSAGKLDDNENRLLEQLFVDWVPLVRRDTEKRFKLIPAW